MNIDGFIDVPKPKKVRKYTAIQRKLFDAKNMPQDFDISAITLSSIINLGYDAEDVNTELDKFYHYFKSGAGIKTKSSDWSDYFKSVWIHTAYSFNAVKKFGKYKNDKQSFDDKWDSILSD